MTTDPPPSLHEPDELDELDRLERGPVDEDDLAALDALRAVYEHGDPVPPHLVDRVKFAITLDDLEAEVARLQRDAVPELVARSEATDPVEDLLRARSVTFTSDLLTTMVTITPLGDTVRLDGWAAPGAHLQVELRTGDTSRHVTADEDGRFVIESVPHGLAQLILRPAEDAADDQHPVVTPAIEL